MKQMKRQWEIRGHSLVPLIVVMIVIVAAAFTIMYMTHLTDTVKNTFTMGTADVTVEEPNVDDSDNVAWGENSKNVILTNTGDIKGVVRAMIVPVLNDTEGNPVGGNLGEMKAPDAGTNTLVMGDITLHFDENWEQNWFYKDGYFYYKRVLEPGKSTEKLLKGVTLTNGNLTEAYGEITVTIDVLADILQTEGNAPSEEWGVTVSETGAVSSVTP